MMKVHLRDYYGFEYEWSPYGTLHKMRVRVLHFNRQKPLNKYIIRLGDLTTVCE